MLAEREHTGQKRDVFGYRPGQKDRDRAPAFLGNVEDFNVGDYLADMRDMGWTDLFTRPA